MCAQLQQLVHEAVLTFPSYKILIPSILKCGCIRSAADFSNRALRAFPDINDFVVLHKELFSNHSSDLPTSHNLQNKIPVEDLPDRGFVRRELYPWNQHEPDRFSHEALQFLNEELERIAPKLRVEMAELPSLRFVSCDRGQLLYLL